jgi:hypothetical protein
MNGRVGGPSDVLLDFGEGNVGKDELTKRHIRGAMSIG